MASGGPSMYHPWPSMEFAMTTYKLDPLVARPGPSIAMDGMPWSLSTGSHIMKTKLLGLKKFQKRKRKHLSLSLSSLIFHYHDCSSKIQVQPNENILSYN